MGIHVIFLKGNMASKVLNREIPKAHWGIDGKPATEARKDSKPPI